MPQDTPLPAPGKLHIVATPIGNLGDLSQRSVEVLKTCNPICAEDTRRLRGLLSHLGITKKNLVSLHAHSPDRVVDDMIAELQAGAQVALVTDAGTPCVSDPGSALILACHQQKLQVQGIPGASAVTLLASVAGFVHGGFTFLGFLPRSGGKRRDALLTLQQTELPILFFESPQRMAETLRELAQCMPERRVCIGRELTKLHEELIVGLIAQVAAQEREWRGEITVALEARAEVSIDASADAERERAIGRDIEFALEAAAHTKALAAALAARYELPKKELYARILEIEERRRAKAETGS